METFAEQLNRITNKKRSFLCVGLDPDPKRMPISDLFEFNKCIVDSTIDLVAAYKPNLAFYEALGLQGLDSLRRTLDYIRTQSSEVLIIGDGKRGDIGHTSAAYAKALYIEWQFDAATVNAYAGLDSIQPFLSYKDKGVFIWCRSSNPGAVELQDLKIANGEQEKPLYEYMASHYYRYNINGNMGLVVGATYGNEIKIVRAACPDVPFLLPGVGAQKGDMEEALRSGIDQYGRGLLINSSRSIIYASSGLDFAEAARFQALNFNSTVDFNLGILGKEW